MQHAIARQAEAERERRAKIINAEGEFQAAAKLGDAADVIGRNPVTLQLRYLQTLREIGGSQNSTVVFPMPIDLMKPLLEVISGAGGEQAAKIARQQAEAQLQAGQRTELAAGEDAGSEGSLEIPAPAAGEQFAPVRRPDEAPNGD